MRSTKSMSVVLLLLVVLWYFMAIPAISLEEDKDPWEVDGPDTGIPVGDVPTDAKDSGTGNMIFDT